MRIKERKKPEKKVLSLIIKIYVNKVIFEIKVLLFPFYFPRNASLLFLFVVIENYGSVTNAL